MNAKLKFNLLETVETGGCSAKLPADLLGQIVSRIPTLKSDRLLVGTDTSDDAAVWLVNEDTAIINTADFFPPLCADPYDFGQIAAANALSDVFAMGGEAITCLNLVTFPAKKIDISVLEQILAGGADKVIEAGAHLAGGHTIEGYPPKYGLAVTGTVHPNQLVRNDRAKVGDVILLTKPIGTGVIMAGHRLGEATDAQLTGALNSMKQLNRAGAVVMRAHGIVAGTDVTGFGLLGHCLEMAKGSGVSIEIRVADVPLLDGARDLMDLGCIPGASFRNLSHVEKNVSFETKDYSGKMLLLDAQTSGGLLIACPEDKMNQVIADLRHSGYPETRCVGTAWEQETGTSAITVK